MRGTETISSRGMQKDSEFGTVIFLEPSRARGQHERMSISLLSRSSRSTLLCIFQAQRAQGIAVTDAWRVARVLLPLYVLYRIVR